MSDRWSRTRAVLEDGIHQGLHTGAAVAIALDGGFHSFELGSLATRPGGPLPLWLSAAKPLTVAALARLHDAGRLDWDDPVTRWIPEFGGGGKDALTLRHLLTHTGGFRGADQSDPRLDWDSSVAHACAAELEPGWVPGETAGYHANGSWFILGELLQRATSLDFNHVLRREVIDPLDLGEGWFGLDPGQQATFSGRLVPMLRTGRQGGQPDPILNDPLVISRVRPGSGLRAPATFLCRLYQALLAPPENWLAARTLAECVARQRSGKHDRTFLATVDFGLGFVLNTPQPGGRPMPYGYGAHASPRAFGHSGNQSSCAFADPDRRLAVAWVTDGMPGEPLHQRRQHALNTAVYEDAA